MSDQTEKLPTAAYQREENWLGLAIGVAIIAVICGVFACLWIAEATNENGMLTRSRILTPVGTIFIAAVTFCTVVWRGIVGTRQADEQQRANDAKDDENTAKLLIEGTKLLGEKEISHKLAGIAALQSVALDRSDKFSIPVMDILMDLISDHYHEGSTNKIYLAARRATRAAAERGRKSSRTVTIDMSLIPKRPIPRILGAATLKVKGGEISRTAYERFKQGTRTVFEGTEIQGCLIGREAVAYKKCTFSRCSITHIGREFLVENTFISCDFSDANVSALIRHHPESDVLDRLKAGSNFFRKGSPPIERYSTRLAEHLIEWDGVGRRPFTRRQIESAVDPAPVD